MSVIEWIVIGALYVGVVCGWILCRVWREVL
jgi:hypothetical protein